MRPPPPAPAPQRSEENKLEEYIKGIVDSGCKVILSGSAVGEMALHFCEKYGLMVVRIPSKFELARMCKATSTTARATFGSPSPDELGFAKSLQVQVGGRGAARGTLQVVGIWAFGARAWGCVCVESIAQLR